ncbi:MAG: glycosyltransferase family 4 protein [Promethearchaeota archaeon]
MNDILYLPTRYFPAISGAEFYFQRMAEILNSRYNYNIEIFTSNAIDFKALRDPLGKLIKSDNKFFYKVNSLKINRFPVNYSVSEEEVFQRLKHIEEFNTLNLNADSVIKYIKNGPYLEELIDFFVNKKNKSYGLVHTTFYPYFNLIISLMIGKKLKVPTICTPFFHFANPRYSDSLLIEILKKFDLIIACTNAERRVLIDKFKIQGEKITVIPMGVDYELFESIHKNKLKKYYFKEAFFHNKEKKFKLVLYCGNKNFEKGAISILRSIPYIIKEIKKVYFVFIGPSTKAYNHEISKIQKLKNVRIINFTPDNLTGYYDKKKLTAFKEADVYVMPSRSDAFGIAFLEAWAAGIPVIGARIGATPEVIRENIDGLLVEFDNPLDIAQKVIKLLKSKKLKKKLGLTGQRKVSQNYTWDIIAKKTHKTYQNLLTI